MRSRAVRRAVVAGAVAFTCLGTRASARADPLDPDPAGAKVPPAANPPGAKEAEQLFRAARAAFERREFRGAAAAFEEAYRHAQHGSVLYNAGVAWQTAGDEPRAADAFARALARADLDPEATNDAERRLADLTTRVGRIVVTGSPALSVSIAHLRDVHPPFTVYVPQGRHEMSVAAAGVPARTRTVDALSGMTTSIDLLPPPTVPHKEPDGPKSEPSSARWVVSGTVLGVAAASAATAGVLGISALDALDRYEGSGFTDADARSTALDLKTAANVMWATAAVTGIAAVVLFLALPSERTVTVGRISRGGFAF